MANSVKPSGHPAAATSATDAQKAKVLELLSTDSAEDAAVRAFSAALDHFEANIPPFRAGQAQETVHQMRVGLRRLRAATGLFREAVSGPSLDAAKARAREIAGVLGHARNWDVFRDMLDAGPARALADEPGFHPLLHALELNRGKAYCAARETIDGEGTADFLADFRKSIAARDWIAAPGMRKEGSATDFARAALTRLRKRALKLSKGLAKRTPEERHQLRIALKKARYGAEFFESLFSHVEDAEEFSVALAKMQDGLGAFNDLQMANALLDEIDAGGDADLKASGFVRGWFAHAAQAGVAHAHKSERRLRKLKPFWE